MNTAGSPAQAPVQGPSGERPVQFACGADLLLGILHPSSEPSPRGVLIVVGGPQYRVGSHRQFVLLARALAASGIPVLRFDYRGMGDSEGAPRTFEAVGDDLRAAIDAFQHELPELQEVVIWGLCDAASAALFYAHTDARVRGLVLLNPWVRTEAGAARAYVKHYYLARLFNRDLWRKLLTGTFDYRGSLRSLWENLAAAFHVTPRSAGQEATTVRAQSAAADDGGAPLPERMASSFARFRGPVLIILSGRDLTADEFRDTIRTSPGWRRLMKEPRVSTHELAEADHTFSSAMWRSQVDAWTLQWTISAEAIRCA
ncbi:MAG: hydrolase 1, exosortase A system-associated [Gammaproteobacteria bacterium]|nr:hydrolase 1, exosortase A system-associated [Gammaproteobacteria bacterium]